MDMFLNGLHDSSGQPLKAYKVYFWTNSGASTEKTVWSDIDKATVIDQSSGVTLGNKGELDVYGDGEYYVQVKTSEGVLHDSFTISYSSTVDFGGLYIDVGADFGTTGAKIQEALDSLNPLVNYTLLFKDAEFVVGQSVTFPSNVLIKGMITATINQTSGTLTINRTPDLPEFQFFTGTPSITWGSAVQYVKPIWTEGDATISSISYYKGLKYNTISKAETYTASDESVILVDASSGAVTINLPAASGLSGREYIITKTDSSVNNVLIDANSSETINGNSIFYLAVQYEKITLICTGSEWIVVGSNFDIFSTGQIIGWPGTSVPSYALECDGANVSRSTYARLFAKVGTTYGVGDGSTTFTLPDYRGRFLRGFDNAAGTDPDAASRTDRGDGTTGDAVGTVQADEFKSHTHTTTLAFSNTSGASSRIEAQWNIANGGTTNAFGSSAAGGSTETRPKNISVMYCIKI